MINERVLTKTDKTVATRAVLSGSNMHQIVFRLELRPRPTGELTALSRPPSCFGEGVGPGKGEKKKGEGKEGRESKKEGRDRRRKGKREERRVRGEEREGRGREGAKDECCLKLFRGPAIYYIISYTRE